MADHLTGDIVADVVVVGAGPAGSSLAYHLATMGVDVALLEKATFPRDKVCGDGLTPSAVHELALMGMDTTAWTRNRGLRVIGGGHTIELDWPDQQSLPGHGMTRQRARLDHDLVLRAVGAGARLLEGHTVTGAITDANGRIIGVTARIGKGRDARDVTARAKLVVDAGGVSARLSTSVGIEKRRNRPMGVAARTYFRSPRSDEQRMEAHLELWDGEPGESNLLPGYGWIFPMGDGTVNVGLGSVSSTASATTLPY